MCLALELVNQSFRLTLHPCPWSRHAMSSGQLLFYDRRFVY
jgi:hypothetical protein